VSYENESFFAHLDSQSLEAISKQIGNIHLRFLKQSNTRRVTISLAQATNPRPQV
jgi:hypothetical protein